MKFYETHFENYLLENKRFNLHPKLDKIYQSLPSQINKLKNMIDLKIKKAIYLIPGIKHIKIARNKLRTLSYF